MFNNDADTAGATFDPYERWEDATDDRDQDQVGDELRGWRSVGPSDYERYSMLDEDGIDHGVF